MIPSCLPSSRSTLQNLHIVTWYTCTTYCCMHYTPYTLSMGYSNTELNEKPENSPPIVTQICMNSTGSRAGGTGPTGSAMSRPNFQPAIFFALDFGARQQSTWSILLQLVLASCASTPVKGFVEFHCRGQ